MNIAFFDATPHWSGGAKDVYLLYKELVKLGYSPIVCCMANSLLSYKIAKLGGKVEIITPVTDLDLYAFYRIIQVVKKHNIDILDLYSPKFYWIGSLAGKLLKKKVILTRNVPFRKKGIKRQINKLLYKKLIDKCIAQSDEVKKFLVEDFALKEKHITSIVYGVDITEYENIHSNLTREQLGLKGEPVGCIISRLDKNKGLENFIMCLPMVIKEFPNIEFLIVGTGEKLDELKFLAEQYKVAHCIHFLGFRNDIPEIINIIDFAVVPSPAEVFPRSALEPMSCGKPVVATNVGGMYQLIEDGKNGILCSSNTPECLAENIIRLLKLDYKQLGKNAKETIEERFTIKRTVSEYLKVCYEVFSRKGKK